MSVFKDLIEDAGGYFSDILESKGDEAVNTSEAHKLRIELARSQAATKQRRSELITKIIGNAATVFFIVIVIIVGVSVFKKIKN